MTSSKFLERVRNVIRTNHFSYNTEKTYVGWIYRFIIFYNGSRNRLTK
ncbi:MAG: phage integrase N-terminal SAM-like domain-containing protein, partial [Bacteroidetes bacterium]|nr:phage integrase N-terminal SAM-like domain-containing protein [Bacteroidota bacterium]